MQSLLQFFQKYSLLFFILSLFLSCVVLFYGVHYELTAKIGDTKLYECYARLFWQGQASQIEVCQLILPPSVPKYSLIPYEYPLLSLVLFSLPLLFPLLSYQYAFASLVFLFIAATAFFLYRYKKEVAFLFLFFICLGGGSTALIRYDLFPSLLVLFTFFAVLRKRFSLAYLLLLFASLLKLYPVIFFPFLFIVEQHFYPPHFSLVSRLKRSVSTGVLLILFLLLPLTLQPDKNPYSFLFSRPFQIESTRATSVWITSFFSTDSLCLNYTFNSANLVTAPTCSLTGPYTPLSPLHSSLFTLLFVSGYIFILYLLLKKRITFFLACFLSLVLLLATEKVFSPQYLLWIIPFFPFFSFRSLYFVFFLCISYLTFLIYPYIYHSEIFHFINIPIPKTQSFLFIIGLRNLLLLLLFAYSLKHILTKFGTLDIKVLEIIERR